MRVFPKNRDEWIALCLFPFKAYVVVVVPFYGIFRIFCPQPYLGTGASDGTAFALAGYFLLCAPFLLLGAAIQFLVTGRSAGGRTLLFAIFPTVLLLLVLLTSYRSRQWIEQHPLGRRSNQAAAAEAPGQEHQWQNVTNGSFSFSIPALWKKTDAHGVDSFVEEYLGQGIKLSFDFGMYSNNFGDWPKETKFEEVNIHDRAARIGAVKREFHEGYPYSVQVYIKANGSGALSMFAACKSEKEVALARKVFETIILYEKKS